MSCPPKLDIIMNVCCFKIIMNSFKVANVANRHLWGGANLSQMHSGQEVTGSKNGKASVL